MWMQRKLALGYESFEVLSLLQRAHFRRHYKQKGSAVYGPASVVNEMETRRWSHCKIKPICLTVFPAGGQNYANLRRGGGGSGRFSIPQDNEN